MSGYNYAENEPIAHIDLWGLQKTRASIRLDYYNRARHTGQMTEEKARSYMRAEAQGAIIGASLVAPGPEDLVIGAFVATKVGSI